MNEADWFACQDSVALFQFAAGRMSARKLRLFACACVRRAWPLLPPGPLRRAVEVASRFADGLVSADELHVAMNQASAIADHLFTTSIDGARTAAAQAADSSTRTDARQAADLARARVASAAYHFASQQGFAGAAARDLENAAQCDVLREIVGNPFRPVDAGWLGSKDGLLRRLAESLYDNDDLDELPVLADALEEAGCTDPALLDHLRADADHVRGCWALDAVLGRT